MNRALALVLLVACTTAAPQAPPPRPPPYVPQDSPREDRPARAPVYASPSPADPILSSIDSAVAGVSVLPATDCVRDAQAQLGVLRRSAEDRRTSVRAALQRHDDDLVNHELGILRVLASRASQLAAEARACP